MASFYGIVGQVATSPDVAKVNITSAGVIKIYNAGETAQDVFFNNFSFWTN